MTTTKTQEPPHSTQEGVYDILPQAEKEARVKLETINHHLNLAAANLARAQECLPIIEPETKGQDIKHYRWGTYLRSSVSEAGRAIGAAQESADEFNKLFDGPPQNRINPDYYIDGKRKRYLHMFDSGGSAYYDEATQRQANKVARFNEVHPRGDNYRLHALQHLVLTFKDLNEAPPQGEGIGKIVVANIYNDTYHITDANAEVKLVSNTFVHNGQLRAYVEFHRSA